MINEDILIEVTHIPTGEFRDIVISTDMLEFIIALLDRTSIYDAIQEYGLTEDCARVTDLKNILKDT